METRTNNNKLVSISILCLVLLLTKLTVYSQQSTYTDTLRQSTINETTLSFKPNWAFKTKKTNTPFNAFKANNLPFFCKIEHNIEKKSKIPLRFRIGDLNYVNMLENKP